MSEILIEQERKKRNASPATEGQSILHMGDDQKETIGCITVCATNRFTRNKQVGHNAKSRWRSGTLVATVIMKSTDSLINQLYEQKFIINQLRKLVEEEIRTDFANLDKRTTGS